MTGTVVENKEYDKVLVKLDGSGRLTTKNRRFVKKIISPPDPAQTGMPQAQSDVLVNDDADVIPDGGGDIIPELDSGLVENVMSDDQISHDSQGDEVGGIIDNGVTDNTVTNEVPVSNGRPKRDRKQNVRYSSREYDLSAVSMSPGTVKLKLSSIYIQPKSGKLKKMINRRV